MKLEELMIGDWVMCNHYQDKSFYKQFGLADFIKGDYQYCEPIPLTHEILKKNGFRLQSDRSELGTLDTYWFGSEPGGFRIHRLNNGDYQFGLAKIRNVHELQHALRLCGINKEIEI